MAMQSLAARFGNRAGQTPEDSFDCLLDQLQACHASEVQDLRRQLDSLRRERRHSVSSGRHSISSGPDSINAGLGIVWPVADQNELRMSPSQEDAAARAKESNPMDYTASQSTAKLWRLGRERAQSKKSLRRTDSLNWDGGLRPFLRKIVAHPCTDCVMCALILCNAVVFAFEAQYRGLLLSQDLGFPDPPQEGFWPGATDAFYVLEMAFGVIFTVEVSIRLFAEGLGFFRETWNWLDFCVISVWLAEQFITTLPINSQILRLGRIFRLLRLLRLVRRLQEFDALFLMTTAIRSSASVLGWTMALLIVCQLLLALVVQQVLFGYFFDPEAADQAAQLRVYEYFGTFSRSLLSLFELTLANFAPITRLLVEDVSEWSVVICLMHKVTMGFAVIGVINAVLMQETFKVAYLDDTVMVREKTKAMRAHVAKMSELFHDADTSGDGKVDYEEFQQIMKNNDVKVWLAAMELDVSNVEELFKMLDTGGDGRLSAAELVQGVSQLSGTGKAQDVRKILKTVAGLEQNVHSLALELHHRSFPASSVREFAQPDAENMVRVDF